MPFSESTIVHTAMSDGVRVAMRVYGPLMDRRPVLLAASPYRFDNDDLPETSAVLWKETGPIDWYVGRGYTYAHLDVRGTGRSEGEYEFLGPRERRDLYEVIEWIAGQSWCTGKIGGIGHSYYAASQWCMASERPPHLACIAPYDGGVDLYRQWTYHGGIYCDFQNGWWQSNVRPSNLNPLTADAPKRDLPLDLPRLLNQHPMLDSFWRERDFAEKLDGCTVPVFSFGVWCKPDLHLPGNLEGFSRCSGPKHLLVSGIPSMPAAQAQFESISFHEKHLLPFYDKYLKGGGSDIAKRPAVALEMRDEGKMISADAWPPPSKIQAFWLAGRKSGASQSLNDGSLASEPVEEGPPSTTYGYPDPKWSLGNVELTEEGPDPTSRNLTFTSAPLPAELDVVGYPSLRLFLSSTRHDADLVVKLAEVLLGPEKTGHGSSKVVAKGWLRASHRAILDRRFGIRHRHDGLEPLEPGSVYELEFSLTPLGHRFKVGSRIRLDISCTDSPVTDSVFWHPYTPDKVGEDTIHHGETFRSALYLPIMIADCVEWSDLV